MRFKIKAIIQSEGKRQVVVELLWSSVLGFPWDPEAVLRQELYIYITPVSGPPVISASVFFGKCKSTRIIPAHELYLVEWHGYDTEKNKISYTFRLSIHHIRRGIILYLQDLGETRDSQDFVKSSSFISSCYSTFSFHCFSLFADSFEHFIFQIKTMYLAE